jgi:hypothetical protein
MAVRQRLPLEDPAGGFEGLDSEPIDAGDGGVSSGSDVGINPVGVPIEYNPVPVPAPPPPIAPYEPPLPTGSSEPSLPEVPLGPIPEIEDPLAPDVPLAAPPPATATGLPTFGVGGAVSRGLRTPTFRSNRVVGGGAEDVLLKGITQRFGPGIAQAEAPLPSGLGGDIAKDASAFTDEDLLKRSILRR